MTRQLGFMLLYGVNIVEVGVDGRMMRTSIESQQHNAPGDQLTARMASLIISGRKSQQTFATDTQPSASRCDNSVGVKTAANEPL